MSDPVRCIDTGSSGMDWPAPKTVSGSSRSLAYLLSSTSGSGRKPTRGGRLGARASPRWGRVRVSFGKWVDASTAIAR